MRNRRIALKASVLLFTASVFVGLTLPANLCLAAPSAGMWAVTTGACAQMGVGTSARRATDDLLREASIDIEPVDEIQAKLARQAYRTFGRGSGHPARLNLGDCFAYALARRRGEPMLFKGNDFVHTDITPALV